MGMIRKYAKVFDCLDSHWINALINAIVLYSQFIGSMKIFVFISVLGFSYEL